MIVEIPIGKEYRKVSIPDELDAQVIAPKNIKPVDNKDNYIEKAIINPIGVKRISESAKSTDKVAIVVTDITRRLHEDIILKYLLRELKDAGIPNRNIKIIVAVGTHRPNTRDEFIDKYGKDVVDNYEVINHNAYNSNELVNLGLTKSGIPMIVNKYVAEADFKITTGVIEPHLFAGYSGGVKTISVGAAGEETIAATHNYKMLNDPSTRFGVIENNRFREFLTEVGLTVGINFIVNVIQNGKKEIIDVVAGDPLKAYAKGVSEAKNLYEAEVSGEADIIISAPGYPKSLNLYQGTRAWNSIVFSPKPIIKQGGTIIIPTPCEDGIGHHSFKEWMTCAKTPDDILRRAETEGFRPGEQKGYIAGRVLKRSHVVITDCLIDKDTLKSMMLDCEDTVEEALLKLLKKYKNPKVVIMPYGLITLPIVK